LGSGAVARVEIRPAAAGDAAALARIYNFYVEETIVTFEEEAVSAAAMSARLREVQEASLPWLVAAEAGEVVGYAYAAKWKVRRGYRFSVEVTIYLDHRRGRAGIGTRLYGRLLSDLTTLGMHMAIGGIALPNPASVALHEKLGFRKTAHFHEIGLKFDRWIDVGYWEKRLPGASPG
jgi:L-amino acid N-acyltransferase YncA